MFPAVQLRFANGYFLQRSNFTRGQISGMAPGKYNRLESSERKSARQETGNAGEHAILECQSSALSRIPLTTTHIPI